ncbi:head GIN domain-containing protein [uncultured Microscilla sp.]|uniref:head GIN domain-containing protein n=1 Tax=uncultured Microscilla sp. TaxID=432653 RepID=UPI0026264827|nr:head GIN domain-containing protein [uncultured Microscilla sp.]
MKKILSTNGIALFILLMLNACYHNEFKCVKGSGAIVEEKKVFDEEIHTISSSLPANVYITQGDTQEVILKAQKNIHDIAAFYVDQGELVLKIAGDRCIRKTDIEVFITIPTIKKVTLQSAGQIIGQNLWDSPNLEVILSGVGKIKAEIKSNSVYTKTSGAGQIKLKGNTQIQQVTLSGVGNYEAFDLVSNKATIKLKGAGNCEVNVTQELNATISGSGNINYKGNPAIHRDISGVGSVTKAG